MIRFPLGLVLEMALVAILLPLAWVRPEMGVGFGRRLGRRLASFVRPWMAAPLCGFIAFVGSLAYSLLVRFPAPHWHDEFSYLLAADTYASGRLTNPTPPFWEHFETFHVLQVPSYTSKYPPGQGLLLALGQLFGGHPILGVWLGTGLACTLICWMLMAWVPYRWALLGGFLAALSIGFSSPWSQSYWGGSLAAAGGALLLGGIRRMTPAARVSHGVAIGLGLVVLAVTRPFEGLLLSLPPAILLGAWLLGWGQGPRPRSVLATCLVICTVLAPAALALAQHNKATTGRFGQMPYMEYEQQYGVVPVFLWSELKPLPSYANDVFRRYEVERALPKYTSGRTLHGFLFKKLPKTFYQLLDFLHLALLGPILFVVFSRWRGWDKLALACSGMVLIAALGNTWTGSRMLAPMAGCLFLLAIQGLRRLRLWRPDGRAVGRGIARILVITTIASTMIRFVPTDPGPLASMPRDRVEILSGLEATGERHLVFVRYSPEHNPEEEWVYNRADLERAQVVWARERTPLENGQLMDYFADRKVWLLEADVSPRALSAYDPVN